MNSKSGIKNDTAEFLCYIKLLNTEELFRCIYKTVFNAFCIVEVFADCCDVSLNLWLCTARTNNYAVVTLKTK